MAPGWIYGPEYGHPGTINLCGQEYDQPVFVWEGNPGPFLTKSIFCNFWSISW